MTGAASADKQAERDERGFNKGANVDGSHNLL